jgi:hypothetical protein
MSGAKIMRKLMILSLFLLIVINISGCSGTKELPASVDVDLFSQGLLGVANQENEWGYVNKEGELAIPFQYDRVYPFLSSGIAKVQKDDRVGVIDTKGDVILPIAYEEIFHDPFQVDETWYFIIQEADFYGLVDQGGNTVFEPIYLSINCDNHDVSGWCHVLDSEGGKYQNVDQEFLLDGAVSGYSPFTNQGVAIVYTLDSFSKPEYYLCDKSGYNLMGFTVSDLREYHYSQKDEGKYDSFFQFSDAIDGIFRRFGVLDGEGDVLYELSIDPQNANYLEIIPEHSLICFDAAGRKVLLNYKGKILLDTEEDEVDDFYIMDIPSSYTDWIIAKENEETYYMSLDFRKIVVPSGLYLSYTDSKNIIVRNNTLIGADTEYDRFHASLRTSKGGILVDFQNDTTIVPITGIEGRYLIGDGEYGIMADEDGKLLHENPRYYWHSRNVMSHGLIMASETKDGKVGFVNQSGAYQIEPNYDYVRTLETYRQNTFFQDGYAIVSQDGKYGVIDENGKIIIPIEYSHIRSPYE